MLQWLKIKKIICRFIHLIILLMCLFLQSRAFATTDVDGAYIQDNFYVLSDKRALDLAQEQIINYGFVGDVIATTYDKINPTFTSLAKSSTDNQYWLLIVDSNSRKMAGALYTKKLWGFDIKDSYGYRPAIFCMVFYNDPHDGDESLGVWYNENHYIPVYVLFNISNDFVNVNRPIYSASGSLHPGHYHAGVKMSYHFYLASELLRQLPKLRAKVNANIITQGVD